MVHLTFKQYLESKECLRKAIGNTPVTVIEYDIKKYCSIAVGEDKDQSTAISLKPKHKMIVEWSYANPSSPTPNYIQLVGVDSINEDDQLDTYWSGNKLQKWLDRHARKSDFHANKK